MKNKILCFTILSLLLSYSNSYSQTSLNEYLNSVRVNNKSIADAKNYASAQVIEAKTNLLPNNPEFEYGYFPGNTSKIGTKQTIGISQTLDFPSTYIYKNKKSDKVQQLVNLELVKTEQMILLNAKKAWIKAVYLNKISINFNKREADAKQLVDFYLKKQVNGDATQLEVNKAKLFQLDIKNKDRLNQSYILQNAEQLRLLNGGSKYVVNDTVFGSTLLNNWEIIKLELDSLLPELKQNAVDIQLANINLKLNKSAWLPNLMLGYESEAILSQKYSGFRAGISIPLWQNNNTIKKAKVDVIRTQSKIESIYLQQQSKFYGNFIEAEALQNNLNEFTLSLANMNNEYLLSRSLELGQISAIEYFYELEYFYNIMDDLIKLEYVYNLSLTDLYRYKL